jgi:hypothetical protein
MNRCENKGAEMTALFINWTPKAIDLLRFVLRIMGL